MNNATTITPRFQAMLRAVASAAVALGLASCNSVNKTDTGYTEYSGKPANYPADGRYNPYPAGSKPAPATTQYQEYSPNSGGSAAGYQKQPTTKSKTTASSTTAKKKPTSATTASSTKKPASSTKSSTTHIVKKGDTLYGLAKKYKTSVAAIKKANNKSSDVLRDGEKLKIP